MTYTQVGTELSLNWDSESVEVGVSVWGLWDEQGGGVPMEGQEVYDGAFYGTLRLVFNIHYR